MAMKNFLNSVPVSRPPRNRFDMSYDYKTTLDMGEMVPVCCTETLPGDTWQLGGSALVRFSPLIAPVMHKLYQRIHYFFVPNRITFGQENWESFIFETPNGAPAAAPTVTITSALYTMYPLIDYLGLPDPGTHPYTVSAFPFAAYQMVYNEYFRDQNQIPPVDFKLVPGDNSTNTDLFELRICAWEHDLFTASLPSQQWGEAVDIPLGTGTVFLENNGLGAQAWYNDPTTGLPVTVGGTPIAPQIAIDGSMQVPGYAGHPLPQDTVYNPNGSLKVEMEPTTINSLRLAFSFQRWREMAMRVGRRLIEGIFGHFGVKSSDARLQRPEYIVGVKEPVIISEVLNTTGETDGLPQGNMAGHGMGFAKGGYGSKFCEEHGFIIGIMTVVPEATYSQGIPNHFLRSDKFDYFWPELMNVGEVPVPQKEVYVQTSTGDEPFGYMPAYYGYRYNMSRFTGQMKTTYSYWHFGRKFDDPPALTQEFIECKPTKDPFAVIAPDVDSLIVHVRNTMFATRLVNKYGRPI